MMPGKCMVIQGMTMTKYYNMFNTFNICWKVFNQAQSSKLNAVTEMQPHGIVVQSSRLTIAVKITVSSQICDQNMLFNFILKMEINVLV